MRVWVLSFFEKGWVQETVGVYSSLDNALKAIEENREENEYGPIEDWEKGTYKHTYYLADGVYKLEMFNFDY